MIKNLGNLRSFRGRMKGRIMRLFGRPASRLLVFLFALVLFLWPFLASWHQWSGMGLYLFLFAAWALVIAMILVLGVCTHSDSPGRGGM